MKFPPAFQFSQSNLQSFLQCRRQFYLHDICRLAWPATISEPMQENERHMHLGDAFHQMMQQYFSGIPEDKLRKQARDPILLTWLENLFQEQLFLGMRESGAQFYPEISLTGQIAGFRVTAKYDLLIVLPDDQYLIYDWKTSRTRPRQKFLADRMQTRLYRYLFVAIGQNFSKHKIDPEQVRLVYWFTTFPNQPETFLYSSQQYSIDEKTIQQTILTIQELVARDRPESAGLEFPLTPQEERCAYCVYRSLCERGVKAGLFTDSLSDLALSTEQYDDISDTDFSLEQVAEIEF